MASVSVNLIKTDGQAALVPGRRKPDDRRSRPRMPRAGHGPGPNVVPLLAVVERDFPPTPRIVAGDLRQM